MSQQTIEETSVREDLVIQTPAIATDDWSELTKELIDSLPQVWTRGLQQQQKLAGQQNRLALFNLLKNQSILALRTQARQNQVQDLEKQSQIEQARENIKALKIFDNLQQAEQQAQVNQAKQDLDQSKIANNLAAIALFLDRQLKSFPQLCLFAQVARIEKIKKNT